METNVIWFSLMKTLEAVQGPATLKCFKQFFSISLISDQHVAAHFDADKDDVEKIECRETVDLSVFVLPALRAADGSLHHSPRSRGDRPYLCTQFLLRLSSKLRGSLRSLCPHCALGDVSVVSSDSQHTRTWQKRCTGHVDTVHLFDHVPKPFSGSGSARSR